MSRLPAGRMIYKAIAIHRIGEDKIVEKWSTKDRTSQL